MGTLGSLGRVRGSPPRWEFEAFWVRLDGLFECLKCGFLGQKFRKNFSFWESDFWPKKPTLDIPHVFCGYYRRSVGLFISVFSYIFLFSLKVQGCHGLSNYSRSGPPHAHGWRSRPSCRPFGPALRLAYIAWYEVSRFLLYNLLCLMLALLFRLILAYRSDVSLAFSLDPSLLF